MSGQFNPWADNSNLLDCYNSPDESPTVSRESRSLFDNSHIFVTKFVQAGFLNVLSGRPISAIKSK